MKVTVIEVKETGDRGIVSSKLAGARGYFAMFERERPDGTRYVGEEMWLASEVKVVGEVEVPL